VASRLGAIESIEATWRRIAQTAVKSNAGAKTTQELTLEEAKVIRQQVGELLGMARNWVRTVVR
jgi:hypothetical protein